MAMTASRRRFLMGLSASVASASVRSLSWAAGAGDHRFVLVLLRGGMDGLAAVPPIGDPDYAAVRGKLALPKSRVLPLDGTFGLHPALAPLADWYTDGHLLPVHAVGLSYRGRSHFDAHDKVMVAGSAEGGRRTRGGRFQAGMAAAGTLMADAGGPRVMVVDSTGWDTHARQGTVDGLLARQLSGLAEGLVALRTGLGATWRSTTVMCISEFGRTVAPNGTGGTDHGTGGVALLAGGAVSGGRVVADWPGLRPEDRTDRRDLRPTLSARQVFKAALQGGLGISDDALEQVVFPGTADLRRPEGWFQT